MRCLAIDPGTVQSAWLAMQDGVPVTHGIYPNEMLCGCLHTVDWQERWGHLAVEMIASYGMPVGAETFESCVWIGRFIEAWTRDWSYVFRKDVKMHVCGSVRAKDGNVRQALLDRFGGKAKAVGKKASRGPLYGISKDVWSALAVAVTWTDQVKEESDGRLGKGIFPGRRVVGGF